MSFGLALTLLALTTGPDYSCPAMLAEAKRTAPAMAYREFDQTEDQGWRRLAGQPCLAEAADLIDFYRANRADLGPSSKVNLSFHAGQLQAMAGNYAEAIKRFRTAEVNPSVPPEFKWSEYVRATIAFLQHDAEELVRNRDLIADAGSFGPNQSNLKVVDRLVANFERPYKEAIAAEK